MLSGVRHLVEAELDVHRLGRLDAAAQERDEAVLFIDRFEQLAQLFLTREFDGGGHLRRALDVNLALGAVAENRGIAEDQRVVRRCGRTARDRARPAARRSARMAASVQPT